MTPERWERIKDLFEQALARDAADRSAFLAEACLTDDIHAQVIQLLEQHESAGNFLERPPVALLRLLVTSDRLPFVFSPEQIVGDRFRIVAPLAKGGMGEVYEAVDLELREPIALKTIRQEIASDPRFIQRFKDEVQRSRAISHPNVCRVYDLFRERAENDRHVWFLTMELLRGETLSERLLREQRLTVDMALPLVKQLCEALAAAHGAGVVHRDFKSGNIMLVPDGSDCGVRAVVTDFGLARPMPLTPTATASADDSVTVIGTPAYMAPERLIGHSATPASDLYSLGVVMYEMLAGERPPSDASWMSDKAKGPERSAQLPDIPRSGIPAPWKQTIVRCLDRDPARRFKSATEVIGELNQSGAMLRQMRTGTRRRHPRPSSRRARTIRSLVVLPLVNLSPEPTEEYFADGMSDALSSAIAQHTTLRVISRTSAMRYKGTSKSVKQIAAELRVDALIEGSVTRVGEQVRVTARLVDTAADRQLWTGTYDRQVAHVLTLQSEVADTITSELAAPGTCITPKAQFEASINPVAYDMYLRAQQVLHHQANVPMRISEAIRLLNDAVVIEPAFPAILAATARAYNFAASSRLMPSVEAMTTARRFAGQALRYDPSSVDALTESGYVAVHLDWNLEAGQRYYERAIEANPSDAMALYRIAVLLGYRSRHDEAVEYINRALSVDPFSPRARIGAATVYLSAGRIAEVREIVRDTLKLDANVPQLHHRLGLCLMLEGHYSEAIEPLLRAVTLSNRNPAALAALGCAYAWSSDLREARLLLDELKGRPETVCHYNIAELQVVVGDVEGAFQSLDRAVLLRDPALLALNLEPAFASVRDLSRFHQLLVQVGLVSEPTPKATDR